MEEVLEVYARPCDAARPLICMGETGDSLPMAPEQPERIDHEYQRQGVANLFISFEPRAGQRHQCVTDRRTRLDRAEVMLQLADVWYADTGIIIVVLDNLNTHSPASYYEAFPPQEAHRLTNRFEFHYTPKHGSWLNMAEIELSVLSGQCLNRRIPDQQSLATEVAHWEAQPQTRQS